jgi:hypothetical protein
MFQLVVYLTTLFQWLRLCNMDWRGDTWMLNWKGCGRKVSCPNLRYYFSICLEGLRKTTKICQGDGLLAEILARNLPNYKRSFLFMSGTRSQEQRLKWNVIQSSYCSKPVFRNLCLLTAHPTLTMAPGGTPHNLALRKRSTKQYVVTNMQSWSYIDWN